MKRHEYEAQAMMESRGMLIVSGSLVKNVEEWDDGTIPSCPIVDAINTRAVKRGAISWG